MTKTKTRRAVLWDIPPELEAWRRHNEVDRHDEVWAGVVHMGPYPTGDHQGLVVQLAWWLCEHWQRRRQGRVFTERNVARPGLRAWQEDYRGPDLVLVRPARYPRDRNTHFDGGPNVVIEIRTPGDESYDKLPFYFDVGVEEAWIIHRDTKVPEVFVRGAKRFVKAKPKRDGWLTSKVTGIELRAAGRAKLALRLTDDHATQAVVPDDG